MDLIHTLTDAQHLLSGAGLVGLAVVVFVETGLLVGFFLPGDSLLFTAGMLAAGGIGGQGPVAPLWVLLLVVPAAAFLGDQTGFLIGRRLGPAVLESKVGRRIGPDAAHRATDLFGRRGTSAVFLARFIPVLRTLVPVTAGFSGMDHRRFTVVNAAGAVVWGTLVPVLGYLLGGVPPVRDHIDIILPGIVVVSVLPVAVSALKPRVAELLHRVPRPSRAALGVAGVCAVLLAVLGAVVATGVTDGADRTVVVDVAGHRTGLFTPVMTGLSTVFAPTGAVLLAVTAAAVAGVVTRSLRAPAVLTAVPALAMVLCYAVKIPLDRPRPDAALQLMTETDGSFPSGHVTGTTVLLTVVVALLLPRVASVAMRRALVTVAVLLVAGVAVSRVYVGDHYPTDVLGGFLTAATVLALTSGWWWPRRGQDEELRGPGADRGAGLAPATAFRSASENVLDDAGDVPGGLDVVLRQGDLPLLVDEER